MRRLLALGAAALVACSGNNAQPCKLHSDCPETLRCIQGYCTLVCRVDRDCNSATLKCIDGDCVEGGTGGGTAAGGGSSASGGGAAATGGGSAMGGGAATGGGSTASGGGSAAGGGTAATGGGSASGGGAATGGGSSASGGGTAASGGGSGTGQGQYGDSCMHQSDCASNLCVGMVGSTTGICTIHCADESACMLHHGCLSVSGVNICVPSDSGQSCPSGQGTNCFAGICLQHPTTVSKSVCATPCDTPHACPANFSCSLTQVGSQQITVCTPNDTVCATSNDCVSRYCGTSKVSSGDGVCEGTCATAADCPTGWACGLDDDGQGGLVSVCQPIGGACTVTNNMNGCYSQTCAVPDPPATAYCTALCMSAQSVEQDARCPSGFNCINESGTYVCEPQ